MGRKRKDIKVKKNITNLKPQEKWGILEDYMSLKMSTSEIAKKYKVTSKSISHFIRRFNSKFYNARSIKTLMVQTSEALAYRKQELLEKTNPETLNKEFLELVSREDEPLTQEEILFAELLLEYGDDITAIRRANLDVGLIKNNRALYKEAMQMRAFYLKKKLNVRDYITQARKRNLELIEEGKEYVQQTLLEVVEQLKNSGDIKTTNSKLKAIELIGRTLGVFDDKLSVNHSNGDDALDRILEMASANGE